MVWRVALTKLADRDLEEAVAFLAAKSPAAAERLGLGLVDTIFELVNLPHKGAPLVARLSTRAAPPVAFDFLSSGARSEWVGAFFVTS